MHKFKITIMMLTVVACSTIFAQFLDPERKPGSRTGGAVFEKVDDFFPVIIPDHSMGDTTEIKKDVSIISNRVDQLDERVDTVSNEVDVVKSTTLKSDRHFLTNNVEFVSSVRSIADAGTFPVDEFNKMKADVEKYRTAFSNMTTIAISPETNIDELKSAILLIKNAASSIIQNQ